MEQKADLTFTQVKIHKTFFARTLSYFKMDKYSSLFYYSVIMLFITLADTIMSYSTPNFLEDGLGNAWYMGLIFSTSSMVGFVVDFCLGKFFASKRYDFFLRWTLLFGIGFPVSFLFLPSGIITFLIGLAAWGIYYEFITFSNTQFIVEKTDRHSYEFAWGILFFFKAISLTFGPILASNLLDISYEATFITAIAALVIAAVLYIANREKPRISYIPAANKKEVTNDNITFKKELQLWFIFSRRLWPLLIFGFGLIIVDSGFWTVGTILSEELHQLYGGIPGLLLVLYSLPTFFMEFFTKQAARPYGKKRAAFITALIGSVFLVFSGMAENLNLIFLHVFIFSCFFALSWPEIKGAFADYDSRLIRSRNSLIGLEASFYSLAYVVGPIICGFLAERFGFQQTFAILGIGMVVITIICLVAVPRKIKMPQSELEVLGMD